MARSRPRSGRSSPGVSAAMACSGAPLDVLLALFCLAWPAAAQVSFESVSCVGQGTAARTDPTTLSFAARKPELALLACTGPEGLKTSADGAKTWKSAPKSLQVTFPTIVTGAGASRTSISLGMAEGDQIHALPLR